MTVRRRSSRAFTLLELVLVLVVMTVLLSAAAPSLRGWSRGARLEDAAEQFLAATRWARSQAVATATIHRLQCSAGESYTVQMVDRAQAQPATGEFARTIVLPPGVRIEVMREDGAGVDAIEFFPTGRIAPARVRFEAEWGESLQYVASAAESFREEGARPR